MKLTALAMIVTRWRRVKLIRSMPKRIFCFGSWEDGGMVYVLVRFCGYD